MDVTYGTICSGIECAGLAADALGWTQAFCSEIDPFACAVLAHRRPDVVNLGDATTLAERIRRHGEPFVDVLVAGTPCQSFSIAGLQRSLDDDRGNLTLELVRILDAIDEVRDAMGFLDRCTLVWENVPGVLSTRDNAFGCLLAALVGADDPVVPFGAKGRWPRAGLVRGPKRQACWRILDAQWFGVAQRRKRLFLVAGAGARFDPSEVLLEPEGVSRNPPSRGSARQDVAGTVAASTGCCDENDARDGRLIVAPIDASFGRLQGCLHQDLNHNHSHLVVADIAAPLASRARESSGYRNDADTTENLVVAYGGNNTSGPIDVATARSAHGGPHGRLDFETETFLVTVPKRRTSRGIGMYRGTVRQGILHDVTGRCTHRRFRFATGLCFFVEDVRLVGIVQSPVAGGRVSPESAC